MGAVHSVADLRQQPPQTVLTGILVAQVAGAAARAIPLPNCGRYPALDNVTTRMARSRGAGFIQHQRMLSGARRDPRENVLECTVHRSVSYRTVVFAALAVVGVLRHVVADPNHVVVPAELVRQRIHEVLFLFSHFGLHSLHSLVQTLPAATGTPMRRHRAIAVDGIYPQRLCYAPATQLVSRSRMRSDSFNFSRLDNSKARPSVSRA